MIVVPAPTVDLGDRFARELPEMAIGWRAEEVADPKLLVLNEPLAGELGFDPHWLRSPEGLRLLVGNSLPAGAVPVALSSPRESSSSRMAAIVFSSGCVELATFNNARRDIHHKNRSNASLLK